MNPNYSPTKSAYGPAAIKEKKDNEELVKLNNKFGELSIASTPLISSNKPNEYTICSIQ